MKYKVNIINKILRIIVQFASYILKLQENIEHVKNFNFNGVRKERVSCCVIRKFLFIASCLFIVMFFEMATGIPKYIEFKSYHKCFRARMYHSYY